MSTMKTLHVNNIWDAIRRTDDSLWAYVCILTKPPLKSDRNDPGNRKLKEILHREVRFKRWKQRNRTEKSARLDSYEEGFPD